MSVKKADTFKKNVTAGAQRELLEQLFDDHYKYRFRIYKVNFFRGVFFGLGSVIGATIVVGFILWILSLFTYLPFIGDYAHSPRQTIETKNR